MNTGLAIELAEQLIEELGHHNGYLMRFRHFQIPPQSKIELNGQNEVLILIEPSFATKMYSKSGMFNQLDKGIKEMQYIHRGITTIINQSKDSFLQVKVLQIIPKLSSNS
jgi:hypothetical protein